MPLDLLATLRTLVSIPSVNPMGRAAEGPQYFEHRVTDFLEQLAARHGIPSQRQTVAPLRDNLLLRVDGEPSLEQGGELLLLEAHQDTVPVEGMTIAPFEPVLIDRRLSGRGSCDIKGGMTSMLGALVRVLEEQPRPRPTIVMACTVNEEHGFTGATALCSIWSDATNERTGLRNSEQKEYRAMIPRRPNAAIVAEPTNLQVVVAHKGMVRWRCHTLGRAAHSSTPERGANAIFRMAQVLAALERYQQEKVGLLAQHALCGRPTLSVGTITGGLSVNTVPDRCTIEIDRRLVPGENPRSAQQQVIDYVAAETRLADQILHDAPCMQSPGLNNERNQLLAARMRAAAFAITGEDTPPCGVAFGTDAALIGAAGVPCVVFGPGSIAQAHTADEWVPIAEVELASEALYRLIIDWTAR